MHLIGQECDGKGRGGRGPEDRKAFVRNGLKGASKTSRSGGEGCIERPIFGQLSGSLRLSAPTGEIIKMGSVGQDTPFLPFVGETLWNRLSQLPLPPFACRFAQPPLHNRTLRASRMHTSSFTRDREIYAIKHGAGGASAKRISATADLDAAEISS